MDQPQEDFEHWLSKNNIEPGKECGYTQLRTAFFNAYNTGYDTAAYEGCVATLSLNLENNVADALVKAKVADAYANGYKDGKKAFAWECRAEFKAEDVGNIQYVDMAITGPMVKGAYETGRKEGQREIIARLHKEVKALLKLF